MLDTGLLVYGHTITQLWRMMGVLAMQLTSKGFDPICEKERVVFEYKCNESNGVHLQVCSCGDVHE